MRQAEFEVLRRLEFKIGEGDREETSQIMQIHEKIITFVDKSSVLKELKI